MDNNFYDIWGQSFERPTLEELTSQEQSIRASSEAHKREFRSLESRVTFARKIAAFLLIVALLLWVLSDWLALGFIGVLAQIALLGALYQAVVMPSIETAGRNSVLAQQSLNRIGMELAYARHEIMRLETLLLEQQARHRQG